MKHLVQYDDQTGNVEDYNGYYIGSLATGLSVPEPFSDNNKGPSIDDIIKLKASGFTADDIIKMGYKL